MTNDPLIDEVRAVRREISREHGHDIHKLCAHYRAIEKQMKAEGKGNFVSQPLGTRARELEVESINQKH
ncbi:MAG: hypothetical protein ABSE73_09865 [Planctomycetota bacterium]